MPKAQASHIFFAALFILAAAGSLFFADFEGMTAITGMDVHISAAPTVANVMINTTSGTNQTSENLTVYWTTADIDGDKVINITDWRIGNTSIASLTAPFEFDGDKNATDYSTNNNTPSIIGTPVWGPDTGRASSGAWTFNGSVNDCVSYANSNSINIVGNKLTIMAWVNYSSLLTFNMIAGTSYADTTHKGYMVHSEGSSVLLDIYTSVGACRASNASSIESGNWSLITGVYNGTECMIYANGVKLSSTAQTGNLIGAGLPLRIGCYDIGDYNSRFNGTIDEVKVYPRALSQDQILEIYNNGDETIVSQETTQGDMWTACITPNDGTQDGTTVCSNNVTVIPPGIHGIENQSITNESVVIFWKTIALANGSVNYGTDLSLGTSALNTSFLYNRSISISGLSNYTLYYYNVTSYDGYEHFETNGSFNFTTLQNNPPPVVASVLLNSSSGTNTTLENLTAYWNVTDEENDKIFNITDWRINGTSIAVLNMPFEKHADAATNVTDYSTYGNNGTVTGATYNATGGFDGSGAYLFDADGDFINISYDASLEIAGDMTIEHWVYLHSFSVSWTHPVGMFGTEYGTWFDGSGIFEFYAVDVAPNDFPITNGLSTDVWVHLAAVYYEGDRVELYVDGQLNTTVNITAGTISYSGTPNVNIGGYGTANALLGYLDGVKIYNRALSAEQILQNYRNRTDLIVSGETNKGENWTIAVTPNDGVQDGTTVLSNVVTILDTIAPIITNIANHTITNESASINWTTDEASNTSVNYGTSLSLGTKSQTNDAVTAHTRTLTGLANLTLYYYNVTSCDSSSNCAINGTYNFTTLQTAFSPVVSNVILNSSFGTNETDENLTVYWDTSDGNNDKVINNTDWRMNGTSIMLLNYPFEADGSKNGTDYSTYGKDITTVSGAMWTSSGKFGGAYNFSNDYLVVPDVVISNTNTIVVWAYPVAGGDADYGAILTIDADTGLYYQGSSKKLLYYSGGDYLSDGILTESAWNHVAVTNNAGALTFYINGVASGTAAGMPGFTADKIGSDSYDEDFAGILDEMHVYNRVLSIEQILLLNSSRDDMIIHNETNIGENWSVMITPNDGTMDGIPVLSNNITIILDGTPPVISNITYYYIGTGSATVTGTTNEAANTTLNYGITLSLGSKVQNSSFLINHSIAITGLSSSTLYYFNITICDVYENCRVNGTFSFTTATPTPKEPSGGSDYRAQPKEEPVVVEHPFMEAPASYLTTTIDPLQVSLNNFACSENAVTEYIPETEVPLKYLENIRTGYEVLVQPFRLDCLDTSAKLTLSIPDSYTNITALKCSKDDCNPVSITGTVRLTCGEKIFEDVKRQSLYITPDFFPIELTKVEAEDENEIESSNTKIKFVGDAGKVSLSKPEKEVEEAKNPMIRIVGTPTIMTFEKTPDSLNVTLPYVLPEHVDELSIAVYARKDDKWIYLGGDVDAGNKTVSVTIEDISEYAEPNKLTLTAMGLICLNCFEAEFKRVYDGGTRDSVVLVHGFENTPERFEDIINDIRLTNQPWQAWTFGYPSSKPIDENAKDLADLLELHKQESDFVYIAAHSLGGLVTQQALYYAYTENQKNPDTYTFINDLVKVILIATPNTGALTKDPKNLFNMFINSNTLVGLFNVESDVIKELIQGKNISKVPGIEYKVIAGTQPYSFTKLLGLEETNDGLVALKSAQTVGGELIDDPCEDFWSFNTTHTDILNNYDSRKIVERIVAKEIAEAIPDKAVMGYNQYYDLNIDTCSPDDRYIIIGIPLEEEAKPSPGLCLCGNRICGVDENEVNCPIDCARIEKPKASIWGLLLEFKPLRNLLIFLLLLIALIIFLFRRRKKKEQHHWTDLDKKAEAISFGELHPSAPDHEREKLLNNLIIHLRASKRFNEHDKAKLIHERFVKEYDLASVKLKDKFKEAAEDIKKMVKK